MFNERKIKRIVETFDELRKAIYKINGRMGRSCEFEDMRCAEHCASRIIAARIIACGIVEI